MSGDEYKTIWKGRPACETKKSWGSETTIGTLNRIQAKILFLDKGQSTSLKYYTNKNEILFIKKGSVCISYDSERFHWRDSPGRSLRKMNLSAGDVLYVQSNCPYQIFANEFTEIIEIGDNSIEAPKKLDSREI